MSFHCELVILILALTLHAQVHMGEIYGGSEAKKHSRPYMVLVERHMNKSEIMFCGGFLLSEDFVMTAATCKADSYIVKLGLHKNLPTESHVQHLNVAKSFPHENYNKTGYKNDLMLLKLVMSASTSTNVKPIPLADRGGSLPKSCSVCGWGKFDQSNTTSDILREVSVKLSEKPLKEKSYCSEGKSGPALGDIGGPLVCEAGKAYGVVSGGLMSGELKCYTKISEYRDWIDRIMKTDGKV